MQWLIKIRLIGLVIVLISSQNLQAQILTFNQAWKQIKAFSPAQQAAQYQTSSVQEAYQRSEMHWLPRIYIDAKSYRTNDPGNSFFGLLEQRQVNQNDFTPSLLNHPESSTYHRAAIGIDFAIYEGGMKKNQVLMYESMLQAQKLASQQTAIDEYSQAAFAFATVSSFRRQIDKISALHNELQKLIKTYQIGQKSNPVGYSGLLGMQTLMNRLQGFKEQSTAQKQAMEKMLVALGVQLEASTIQDIQTIEFIDTYLHAGSHSESNKILSQNQQAHALSSAADMEKARFLPRIGAFAESFAFKGDRDTANGYTAGLYLQWNLFDASDLGRYSEASLKALALAKQTQALAQQETIEKSSSDESDLAIRKNLILLIESDKLMIEQMKVATNLFKSGALTALQLVEILNRRADLIIQQTDLEQKLIQVSTVKMTKTNFQIPIQ